MPRAPILGLFSLILGIPTTTTLNPAPQSFQGTKPGAEPKSSASSSAGARLASSPWAARPASRNVGRAKMRSRSHSQKASGPASTRSLRVCGSGSLASFPAS